MNQEILKVFFYDVRCAVLMHTYAYTYTLISSVLCMTSCQNPDNHFGLPCITVLRSCYTKINPLKPELIPICYLLAILGAHHFLHVSRIRVKLLNFRLLKSYIYGAPILDVSKSHTTTQHSRQDSCGRVISSSQRPLPDNTRHSQQTNIHAPVGIRTHDLSR